MEKPRIELQKEREFGDVFNATFGFIQQEFKPLGKAILVFVVPVVILMSIALIMFQSSYSVLLKNVDRTDPSAIFQNFGSMFGTIGLYGLIALVGQSIYAGIIYSYLKLYLKRQGEFKLWDIYEELRSCILPIIGASIVSGIIIAFGTVLCFLPGIYFGVSLSMFIPLLVIENQSFGDAFSRSFKLVAKKWWWTFLVILVSFVIVWMMGAILSIPSMILGFSNMFHGIKTGDMNPANMYSTGYIIYSSITSAITQLFYIIPYLAIAFQYFSIVEMEERPSLQQKLDQLGEENAKSSF